MTTFPTSGPPVTPSSEQIGLLNKNLFIESPFSGSHVTTSTGYTQWQVVLGFAPVTNAQAKAFMAWVNSLQGARGSFNYQPAGSGVAVTGKTLSSTANVGTNVINVGGWAAGAATGLTAGDYMSFGGQFFQINSVPANADGSGIASISFEPYVRKTAASGTAVNFATPTIVLRLAASDAGPAMSRDPDQITLPVLNCIEAR